MHEGFQGPPHDTKEFAVRQISSGYSWINSGLTLLLTAVVGCAGSKPDPYIPDQPATSVESASDAVKRISEHPEAFLRESLAETSKAKQFTMHFQRQERLGLLQELKPVEDIVAEYRDEPFSVRFTWQGEDSEYLQCVYVEGKNDNKVVLLPRKGLLGLPPSPQSFDPKLSVVFGKSRNPITDFGPRRMLERTIDRIDKAKAKGEVKIRVLPPTEIGPAKEQCYHLEIRYPQGDEFPCKLQDLYIHMQTRRPVGVWLWLPGKPERSEQTLDGMYLYAAIDPNVSLTDANFVIDPVLRQAAAAGAAEGADSPGAAPPAALSGQPADQ